MFSYFANPVRFQKLARWLIPIMAIIGLPLVLWGWTDGLFLAPVDRTQGEGYRIIYVHVPAVWIALASYAALAGASFVSFVWRHTLADMAAKAIAPIGATFTALGLATGALWGKPMWGAYWVWDARLTSTLVLFFLFLGYMAIRGTIREDAQSARIGALVAMAGAINLPIIKFSVQWWSSLHQPASILKPGGPAIAGPMLEPLLAGIVGYMFVFGWLVLLRMMADIDRQRAHALFARSSTRKASRASAQTQENPDA